MISKDNRLKLNYVGVSAGAITYLACTRLSCESRRRCPIGVSTNQALRDLSGVNGLLVGEWIKAHTSEVITHNTKHGMQNAKDPQRLDTYYNKRHGAEKITKILNLVNVVSFLTPAKEALEWVCGNLP